MNREIKFRAWSHNAQIMHHSEAPPSFAFWKWLSYDDRDLKSLMQFTGINDATGVEIYEGDIVDARTDDVWQDACRDVSNLVVVEWLPIGYYRGFLGYAKGKIVGNIYEHSHLLETPEKTL